MIGLKYLEVILILIFGIANVNNSFAQVLLDSIEIKAQKKYSQVFSTITDKPDSSQIIIQDVLSNINGGQLQMSTPGGLQSFLYRGMGNRHLNVQWNGVNLQSITNGSLDLNLIPTQFFDDIRFYSLGPSSINGNNTLSGTLNLSSNDHKPKWKITSRISSLQNYYLGTNHHYLSEKFTQNVSLSYQYDKNIFSYLSGNQTFKRASTDFRQVNLMYQGKYYFGQSQSISLDFWWQHANRIIPNSITSAPTLQEQLDQNLRSHIKYTHISKNHVSDLSFSFMKENLNYTTPSIYSTSVVNVLTASYELTELLNKDYYFAVKWRNDQASPNFYQEIKSRNTWNWIASKNFKISQKFDVRTSVRQDLVDQKLMPFSASVVATLKKTNLSLSRNYQLPGFNDLYWPIGGNPKLKTEKSWQAEWNSAAKLQTFDFHFSVYANVIDDWIQWTPLQSGTWTAVNQKQAFSRGIEMKILKKIKILRQDIDAEMQYQWNRTTSLQHYFDPSLIGKQFIYIPIHKIGGKLGFHHKNHKAIIQYSFTGSRPETPDGSYHLQSFHILDVNYRCNFKQWTIQFGINNVLNQHYQIVRYFPMPGIQSIISITYSIY